MSVTPKQVKEKLQNSLNQTQASIETLSQYFQFHHKHLDTVILPVFREEFINSKREDLILALLYLCNDIIQNLRKKGNMTAISAFRSFFMGNKGEAEKDLFKLVYDKVSDNTKQRMLRVLGIWKERIVFDTAFTTALYEQIGNESMPIVNESGSNVTAASVQNGQLDFSKISTVISDYNKLFNSVLLTETSNGPEKLAELRMMGDKVLYYINKTNVSIDARIKAAQRNATATAASSPAKDPRFAMKRNTPEPETAREVQEEPPNKKQNKQEENPETKPHETKNGPQEEQDEEEYDPFAEG
jgi:hypothetical protein